MRYADQLVVSVLQLRPGDTAAVAPSLVVDHVETSIDRRTVWPLDQRQRNENQVQPNFGDHQMKQTIRQSFVHPDMVVLRTTPNGTQYVTDRYVIWRVDSAPVKVRQALGFLSDGRYKISAGGAVTPLEEGPDVSGVALEQIFQPDLDVVSTQDLDPTEITYGKAHLWKNPTTGKLWGVNSTLNLSGYHVHEVADYPKPLALFAGQQVVARVMPIRLDLDGLRTDLGF